jgi:tRNA (guanine37-N1)-methyltransferase
VDEEISIGDYILTGGEIPAMVLVDSVARLRPGVLGDENSAIDESFAIDLLEYPQYTRPRDYKGNLVPEVLVCGDPKKIHAWQRQAALEKTAEIRPDILNKMELSEEDLDVLRKLKSG